MALAYQPPGVAVTEVVSPQVAPLLATPASVCLVGPAQGYQTRTDQFVLSGTTPIPLPGLPAGSTVQTVVTVKDALNPSKGAADGSGYVTPADYTVNAVNGTITRVGAGAIADGTLVNVTYNFVPGDYYMPARLFDLGSVESRFGRALAPDGNSINSALSYAALCAFENGAGSIVCQPLFKRATAGDATTAAQQPNATDIANVTTWADTLFGLRGIEDINVLVPVIGQSVANVGDAQQLAIFQAVQDHLNFMAGMEQYIIGILGEDNSTSATVATKPTLRAHAATLQSRYGGSLSQQMVFLSPAKFTRALPGYGKAIVVGGQYVAASIAGMLAAQPVSSPLTREVIAGYINVADSTVTLQDKNVDAAAGLLVVEQRGQNVQIRHSVTLDNTSTANRELSVVRAKHRMIESVRDTMESQIIGKVIADGNSPYIVRSAVVAVLEGLRQAGDLVDYSQVTARLKSLDPTTIQVKFSYRPAFPLNYVEVTFALDLTNQTLQAVGASV